jgi:hypothetical protein
VAIANTVAIDTTPSGHGEPRRVGMASGTLPGLDSLMLSLRFDAGQAGRDIADDPMLVELVTSFPVIRTTATLAMGHASPVRVAASSEDEAPRPLSSPVRSCGSPHVDGLSSGSSGDGTVSIV